MYDGTQIDLMSTATAGRVNMADSSKKEKIAAARKKLKQFQQKAGGRTASPRPQKRSNQHSASPINLAENNEDLSAESSPSRHGPGSPNINLIEDQGGTTTTSAKDLRPTSSTESLHQLSRQLNGLLAESSATTNSADNDSSSIIAELEERNRELASVLERHVQGNEQLTIQLAQVRDHAVSLQDQLEQERKQFSEKQKQDIGTLKEQLQVHIQTIGILVAEKTELQSQLNQSQKIAQTRFDEIDELSGRLKASRQRVADLERSLSTTSSSSQQFEKSSKDYAKDVDRLKLDLYKSNKLQEELKQQTSELQEKLNSKTSECSALEESVRDVSRRLEMAELYAQQLSSQGESSQHSLQMVEQLQQEREELLGKVQQLNEAFQRANTDRDQVRDQYQQYIDQLQNQSQQLTQQVSSLTEEREALVTRQHDLESAVLELQRKLEDVDSQQSSNKADDSAKTEMKAEIEKLQSEYDELRHRHEAQIRDNSHLSRFLEEKEDRISELEGMVEQLGEQAGDKAQLLESVQNDKTALSRALTQNKELKGQLAELQNGFVKMSNDNMDLMTKLQTENHSSKELAARLGQQEDELKDVREALAQKEAELHEQVRSAHEAKREMFHQEQIQDRLRHYEAQAHLVETLQKELHSAQDMVDALTTQNGELRAMLIKATETGPAGSENFDQDNQRGEVLDSLTNTIKQLEGERNQLLHNLKEQRNLSDSLSVKVADLEEEVVQRSKPLTDNDKISRADYDQLRTAMEMIQEKYTKVMRDKAELSDKADQLEHLVTQLEGETETIGEYISLYHHQRALLQQREFQKNEYIEHLAQDREEMQSKLGELQSLVMQMLGERHMMNSYAEESLRSIHSPDVSIQPHLPGQINGQGRDTQDDWPDYTSSDSETESEVETIVGGSEEHAAMTGGVPSRNKVPKHHHHHHQAAVNPHNTQTPQPEENQTAHKILDLLSEIGQANIADTGVFPQHCILPCKYCKGKVQVL